MTDQDGPPKGNRKKKDDMRYGGTQSLAAIVPRLARKAVGKRGFMDARILNEWPMIVGADLARHAHPDRLTFPRGRRDGGTLHIRAMGPMATELQHLEPVLVDRINSHFGYRAVAGIKLLQVPPTRLPADARKAQSRKPPAPPADPRQLADLDRRLEEVEDPELRAILRRLGEGILRRNART
ncbi:DUF721 domain-containing protein [Pacificispira sp.]|uniref:DUF721 domain-containing protein n=1 Tax=Pacificispira sp. TaxID=2888761 RepID=UPI003BACDA58